MVAVSSMPDAKTPILAIRRQTLGAAGVGLLLLVIFALTLGNTFRFGMDPLAWAAVYAVASVWLLANLPATLDALVRARWAFLVPVFALISAGWSLSTLSSSIAAAQFIFSTVLAARLATAVPPKTALVLLFVASGLGLALSYLNLATGLVAPAIDHNGSFIGIFTQKNVTGRTFALCAFAALAVGFAIRAGLIGIAIYAALAPAILSTNSASSLIAYLLGSSMIALMLFSRTSATVRFTAVFGGLLALASFGILTIVADLPVFDSFLDAVGKDSTLTGRTELWHVGYRIWAEQPVLGVGYQGFWSNPTTFDEINFIHGTVDDRINGFHNTFLEAFVSTGAIGGTLFLIFAAWTLFRTVGWYIADGSAVAAGWLVIVLICLVLGQVDNVMFRQHEVFHILMVLAFLYAGSGRRLMFKVRS